MKQEQLLVELEEVLIVMLNLEIWFDTFDVNDKRSIKFFVDIFRDEFKKASIYLENYYLNLCFEEKKLGIKKKHKEKKNEKKSIKKIVKAPKVKSKENNERVRARRTTYRGKKRASSKKS